jgi:flagella basal body P-ring formation protein FlgA
MAWAAPAQPIQDPGVVAAQVESLLRTRTDSYPGTATIVVDPPRITKQPACSQFEAFLPGSVGLRPRISVRVRCLAPQPWTLYVQASIRILGYYFVANHTIQRGDILSLDDLDTREGDLLRNNWLIADPAHVVGWIATRRIPSGGKIRSSALRDPQSIQRGQMVRTVARGMGFVVTGEGKALEAGGPGTQIQVRSSSGQIITGTVIDAHTVQVIM